ncbi:uncharacterized protein [Clytia hemisphaerica]|uniref:Uncharacterized protein n=1 Tax=Clytia hemisphaerica TaxID=252671 RepID=A0A7M5XAS9_9CNID
MTETNTLEKSKEYKKWTKLLKKTTYISYFLIFLGGLEINAVQISMLYYLEESFKMTPDEVRLYYSLAEAFNALGQCFSGLLIGRYMDRTRNLKLSCLLILCATIVGNLLYSLPVHVSFIVIGRFLCGFNEAFQVAFCGEFKRCYHKEDELIQVLSWYELFFAIGMATGPGAPVIFSWVYLKIGGWIINKYNALHVFLVVLLALLFIILWFQLTDLSKDLDRMREKFNIMSKSSHEEQALKKRSGKINSGKDRLTNGEICKSNKHAFVPKGSRKLMEWRELLQIDIISLCTCYTIIRYCTNASVALITMDAATLFHWPVSWISWLTIAGACTHFLVITTLIKCRVFKGLRRNYFFYLSALNLTFVMLAIIPLPRIDNFKSYTLQLLYLAFLILAKGWTFFNAQSAGKILLFNTVTPENSCLIDSIRSSVGSLARLFAFSTSFLCFKYPGYFILPAGTILFIGNCVIVYRYKVLLYNKSKGVK